MPIGDVELLIFGPENSFVTLSFSGHNKRPYSIQAKRHLPVQFAMGLAFSNTPPYEVVRVNPNDTTDTIRIGDQLILVDGAPTNTIRSIQQQVVFGRIDSSARLTLRDPSAGSQLRTVLVRRHLPATAWARLNDADPRRPPSRASSARSGGGGAAAAWSPPPQAPPGRTTRVVFDADGGEVTGEFI